MAENHCYKMRNSQWNYALNGADWCENYAIGTSQSPIDINSSTSINLNPDHRQHLSLSFSFSPVTVMADQAYGAYRISGDLGTLVANSYNKEPRFRSVVNNFHFHCPAETKIDGQQFDLEMHMVTLDPSKRYNYIVVCVLMKIEGDCENLLVKNAILAENKEITFNLTEILGEKLDDFYKYEGSLTFPPCTEGVLWLVDSKIQKITQEQYEFFHKMWAGNPDFAGGQGNVRLIQELNGRFVEHHCCS